MTLNSMNILIIGAGLSGLTAARELTRNGHDVVLVDKGRGVGGRLSTRRLAGGRADHGAQYFSARSDDFKTLVETMQADGIVHEWHLEQSDPASFQHPRYVGTSGMNSIAKYLADGLNVLTNKRVVRVKPTATGWEVVLDDGDTLAADALLVTLPAPQALTLWRESGLELAPDDRAALEAIYFEPTLAVMLQLSQPSNVPTPGGLKLPPDSPVAWLADNQQKGISPDGYSVTIHASHDYSRQHLDDSDLPALIPELLAAVSDYVAPETVVAQQIHRWRYSNPTTRHEQPCVVATAHAPLRFGGDGYGKGNVEGAYLSGLALAKLEE